VNPWINIPLDDYEAHMAMPTVGQARMLADELAAAVAQHRPSSLALLGCAGGNGLEKLIDAPLSRVVCVDINASYIASLRERYGARLGNLECHVSEVEKLSISGEVDLVFGGLIFEYTALDEALASVRRLLRKGGVLCALVQVPATGLSTVSPSPYAKALTTLSDFFRYVSPEQFIDEAQHKKLTLIDRQLVNLDSGKSFTRMKLEKP
jgi:SAM-dependent methyltransferase